MGIRADRIVHTRARNVFSGMSISKNNFAPLKVNGRDANDVECVLYCAEQLRKNPSIPCDRNVRRVIEYIDKLHKEGKSIGELKDILLNFLDFSAYRKPVLEG